MNSGGLPTGVRADGDASEPESIAIVGMACRFPGATTPAAFFRNLCEGVESVRTLPDDELIAAGVPGALIDDRRYVRRRATLDAPADFDAAFFGMSPREAEITDPQQRIFLELAWEALEDAGHAPERFAGAIGVFGGAANDGYLLHHLAAHPSQLASAGEIATIIANEKDHLTLRVAYKLGLRGPAITIQTACSTSLVAAQLACQSLLSYQCDMALAGGVSIRFPTGAGYLFEEGGIMSPDGHCRPFDAGARGTVGGDGAGIVVLRRLGDALADGDHVHAVIRGAAVNNDGAAKVGYTAPGVDGQAEVIALAHALAGVTSDSIGYVEAHGTGTPLGDPIEIAALTQAFRGGSGRRGFCAVGSLKGNVGHLNTSAGVASLIKTALVVETGVIPPTLHFQRPNPAIDFVAGPFFVNAALARWQPGDRPRRAGVSSFGFGGTNAHLVLEEAPPRPPCEQDLASPAWQLLPLSARTPEALAQAARRLADCLEAGDAPAIADVAFTLQLGRRDFRWRRFVVARDVRGAAAALREDGIAVSAAEHALGLEEGLARLRGNGTMLPSDDGGSLAALAASALPAGARLPVASLARALREPAHDPFPASAPLPLAGLTPALREPAHSDDARRLLEAAGQLWCQGVAIGWEGLHAGGNRRRVSLPAYPFQRQRYWIAPHRDPIPIDVPTHDDAPAIERAERAILQRLAIPTLDRWGDLERRLDALCSAHVASYLGAGGIELRAGAEHDVADVRRGLGVRDKFGRLFDVMIGMLVEDGVLERDGDRIRVVRAGGQLEAPAVLRSAIERAWPQFAGLLDFLDHAAASWHRALAGEIDAIGVLYPNGSPRLVADFERRTVQFRTAPVYIELLVEAVRRRVASAGGRRLRILEIGGGQGLLTWPLAAALDGTPVDYHFTDLGRTFVEDARAEAARRGFAKWMRFDVLDASRDPAAQGFAAHGYDVVVAYNVVHATPDVRATIRNLGALLDPLGMLGLVEVVRTWRWDALTWGLADGWWSFADDLRVDSPLLPLPIWESALREAGFASVTGWPRDAAARAESDHGLLLAADARPAGRAAVTSSAPTARTPAGELRGPVIGAPRHPRPALRADFVAPRTDAERLVAGIVAELLGLDRVGVHDDFLELGADSLIMLRITDRVGSSSGADAPADTAFRGATVAQMALAIERAPAVAPGSPLVPIQTGGSRPPLYFVHPAAGVVFPYFELARQLGPDQPFYGLQALGLDGQSQPDLLIEDMARHYIAALRRLQPRGPYFLGGFSFGSLVAFEMAQQLAAAGDAIAMLAVVDEPAPVYGHRPTVAIMGRMLLTGMARTIWPHLHDYFYLRNSAGNGTGGATGGNGHGSNGHGANNGHRASNGASGGHGPGSGAVLVNTWLARATIANLVPPEHRLLALRQPAMLPMFQLFLIHMRQTLDYRPRAYPHRVTLLRAARRDTKFERDPTMGWGQLAAGGVAVEEIPGEHLTVLRPPHVAVLAAKLTAAIAAVHR